MAKKVYDKFNLATLLRWGDRLFASQWSVESLATTEHEVLAFSSTSFGLPTAKKIVAEARVAVNDARLFEAAAMAGEELVGGKTILWPKLVDLVEKGQRRQPSGWQKDPALNLLAHLGFGLDFTPPPEPFIQPEGGIQRSARVQRIYEASLSGQ